MGLGVVIRDHLGRLVATKSVTRPGGFEPAVAEALAALMAIQMSCELGLQQVCLEGDAKPIVDAVNSMEVD